MLKADVLDYFGGVVSTARAFEVTRSAVHQWKRVVPERIAHRAETLSDGDLKFDSSFYPPKSRQAA